MHGRLDETTRAWSERAMPDLCWIVRPDPDDRGTWNPNTLDYDNPSAGTAVYGTEADPGPCRIQSQTARTALVRHIGEEPVTFASYLAAIPASVTDVQVDDVIHVASCTDGQLTGKTLRVVDVLADTFAAQRYLEAELDEG